ncbi:uncharacterized protein G2W53_035679 [Senna tora]|uniref:Uncharacterized protein n=1 Tax=Senna tora TaxID=362788 RepID=A0A834STI3_9FABA|nr:uncharacterized protein G2W53_035679 [Senna tora]
MKLIIKKGLTWLELKGSVRVLDLALVALVWCATAVGTDVVGGRQQDLRRRSDRGVRRCLWTLWTETQRRVRWFPGDGEDAISSVSSAFLVSRLCLVKGSDRGVRRCSWTLWTVTQRCARWFPGDGGGGSGLLMPSSSLMSSLASEYQQDGVILFGIGV